MSFNDYKDPIISQWHMSEGEKYSKIINNESHIVVSGMIVLVGLPDISERVRIDGYVEIDIKDKITESNQFKVDYTNGYVHFHSSKEGQSVNVERYASRGVNYYPASRVYTKVDSLGNIESTVEDLEDKMSNVGEVSSTLDKRIQDAKDKNLELKNSIFNAETIDDKLSSPDGSTAKAEEINTALKQATVEANTTKGDLDDSIENALIKTSEIDNYADLKKSELDSHTSTKKGELDSHTTDKESEIDSHVSDSKLDIDNHTSTKKGELDSHTVTIKTDLNDAITIANISKTNLESVTLNANDLKDGLDLSISEGELVEDSLSNVENGAIIIAQQTKDSLDTSILESVDKKTSLDASVLEGLDINDKLSNELTGSIKQSIDAKSNLDDSITEGIGLSDSVDTSVSNANTTKTELDSSITTGTILKGELEDIIDGTDLDTVVTDISDLKTKSHTHDNKLVIDDLSDVEGALKYKNLDIGITEVATTLSNGLMSKEDKIETDKIKDKVDKILGKELSANDFTDEDKVNTDKIPTLELDSHNHTNKELIDLLSEDVDGKLQYKDLDVGITNTATPSEDGLMSSTDKIEVDKIPILTEKIDEQTTETSHLKFSELSSYSVNLDSNGIYINTEWKRKDLTVYAESTLLGISPNYNQVKVDYYDKDGVSIEKTILWDIDYDENNFPYKKEVV